MSTGSVLSANPELREIKAELQRMKAEKGLALDNPCLKLFRAIDAGYLCDNLLVRFASHKIDQSLMLL
jgi:hypothetical protein